MHTLYHTAPEENYRNNEIVIPIWRCKFPFTLCIDAFRVLYMKFHHVVISIEFESMTVKSPIEIGRDIIGFNPEKPVIIDFKTWLLPERNKIIINSLYANGYGECKNSSTNSFGNSLSLAFGKLSSIAL